MLLLFNKKVLSFAFITIEFRLAHLFMVRTVMVPALCNTSRITYWTYDSYLTIYHAIFIMIRLETNFRALEKQQPATTCKRLFTDWILEDLKCLLKEQRWYEKYTANDMNSSYNLFLNTLTVNINATCPVTKGKSNKQKNQQFNQKKRKTTRVWTWLPY